MRKPKAGLLAVGFQAGPEVQCGTHTHTHAHTHMHIHVHSPPQAPTSPAPAGGLS